MEVNDVTPEYKDIYIRYILGIKEMVNSNMSLEQVEEYINVVENEIEEIDFVNDEVLSNHLKSIVDKTKLLTTLTVILDTDWCTKYNQTLKEYSDELRAIKAFNLEMKKLNSDMYFK